MSNKARINDIDLQIKKLQEEKERLVEIDADIILAEEHQERMCDLCERHILGCKSSTSTFLCEGSRCEDAIEYLKDALEEDRLDKLPETERKISDYLNRTYSGKRLNEKHQLTETGLWEVRGEDPNCDLGGSHHQPKLGVVEGSLKDALTYAVNNPNFYTWGGGGDVSKITPIQIQKP